MGKNERKEQKASNEEKKKEDGAKKKEKIEEEAWADDKINKKEAEKKEKERQAEIKRLAKKEAEEADSVSLASMNAPAGKQRKAAKAKGKKDDMSELNAYLSAQAKKGPVEKSAAEKKGLVEEDPMNMRAPDVNRERAKIEAEGGIDASGIDAAVSSLTLGSSKSGGEADLHPERRIKAAFAAFEEREMALLKEEGSSLKRSQMKDKIWKEWQKSSENPMNQVITEKLEK